MIRNLLYSDARCREGAAPVTMVIFRQQGELILCQYSIFKCSAAYDRNIQNWVSGTMIRKMKYPGPCAEAAWYRKSMPNEIGLFDENFSLSMEEENLHSVQGSPAGKSIYIPPSLCHS
jgi:hypothetical protein